MTQATAVFKVVVSVASLIDEVIQANATATSGLGNALHHFLDGVQDVDSQTVQFALDDKAKATEDKAAKVRISELRAVYQASLHGFDIGSLEYHAAIKASREMLKAKGILPSGKEKKTEEVLAKEKKIRFQTQALKDGIEPAKLEEVWEVEQKRIEGVPQDVVDTLAMGFVDSLTSEGFDHETIRRVAVSIAILVKKEKKEKVAS